MINLGDNGIAGVRKLEKRGCGHIAKKDGGKRFLFFYLTVGLTWHVNTGSWRLCVLGVA